MMIQPAFDETGADTPGRTLRVALPGAGEAGDATATMAAALRHARETGISRIALARGTYHFHAQRASERFLFPSNNDEGLKRIAFDLSGFDDLEFDGGGSTLVFHGFLVPFLVERSCRVRLRNFCVRFERPFQSEGTILACSNDRLRVAFAAPFVPSVRAGALCFQDAEGTIYPWGRLLEFDAQRREPAFLASDFWSAEFAVKGWIPDDQSGAFFHGIDARDLGSGCVELRLPNARGQVGNVMVFGPNHRHIPALFVSSSRDVSLEDIHVESCGAMGILCQQSRNITLTRVRVAPREGVMVSTTADATHFVGCRGKITVVDCEFCNQMDDAVNVHGNYGRVVRVADRRTLELAIGHSQHAGYQFATPGDHLVLAGFQGSSEQLLLRVASCESINSSRQIVRVDNDLPTSLPPGAVACAFEDTAPDVEIRSCTFRGNRARGVLIGSRGHVEISGNHFHTPGAAILFSDDPAYWFEQGGTEDVRIHSNVFEACNFGIWGNATIESVECPGQPASASIYRGIRVEDNDFESIPGVPIALLHQAGDFLFDGNRQVFTAAYPPRGPRIAPVVVNGRTVENFEALQENSH